MKKVGGKSPYFMIGFRYRISRRALGPTTPGPAGQVVKGRGKDNSKLLPCASLWAPAGAHKTHTCTCSGCKWETELVASTKVQGFMASICRAQAVHSLICRC